jgi:hypothetical protein
MMRAGPDPSNSIRSADDSAYPTLARNAVAAIVDAGAQALIAQPWRVARIIRGAKEMTLGEVAAQAERRGRGGPLIDLNRVIALAQLSAALKSPRFHAAWMDWRNSAPGERTSASEGALCE